MKIRSCTRSERHYKQKWRKEKKKIFFRFLEHVRMCKEHANFQFVLKKAASLKIIDSKSTTKFAAAITCNSSSKDCMYGDCGTCKNEKQVAVPENSQPCWFHR